MEATATIDCGTCVMQATSACDDCVVTFLCPPAGAVPVALDVGEARALRTLHRGGLAPALRHVRRTG